MHDTEIMDIIDRQLNRDAVPINEQVQTLRNLGFVIPEKVIKSCDAGLEYISLLEGIGNGERNAETEIWTPSSDQAFAFDCEVYVMEQMYLDFIKGLQAISVSELSFSDIVQDNSRVIWEDDEGTVIISLRINGYKCEFKARFHGDWIDTRFQGAVNNCLEQQGIEKRFYSTCSEQGVILFYCTEQGARTFEEVTLCYMSPTGDL